MTRITIMREGLCPSALHQYILDRAPYASNETWHIYVPTGRLGAGFINTFLDCGFQRAKDMSIKGGQPFCRFHWNYQRPQTCREQRIQDQGRKMRRQRIQYHYTLALKGEFFESAL